MDDILTAGQVRARFTEVFDRATCGESIIVARHGTKVAAIVPVELLRQYRIWEEREDLHLVREAVEDEGPSRSLPEMLAETLARE